MVNRGVAGRLDWRAARCDVAARSQQTCQLSMPECVPSVISKCYWRSVVRYFLPSEVMSCLKHDKFLNNPNFVRSMLYGLLLACPLGGNPEDCQGHDLRELPLAERISWLESRSDAERKALYLQHLECLECKLHEPIATGLPSELLEY